MQASGDTIDIPGVELLASLDLNKGWSYGFNGEVVY